MLFLKSINPEALSGKPRKKLPTEPFIWNFSPENEKDQCLRVFPAISMCRVCFGKNGKGKFEK